MCASGNGTTEPRGGIAQPPDASEDTVKDDDAEKQYVCCNCGLDIRPDDTYLHMNGYNPDKWVHDQGNYSICYPQMKNSPRAHPGYAVR